MSVMSRLGAIAANAYDTGVQLGGLLKDTTVGAKDAFVDGVDLFKSPYSVRVLRLINKLDPEEREVIRQALNAEHNKK